MRPVGSIARYKLLPEPSVGDSSSTNGSAPAPAPVRRYRLARVGVARRSALGADRHERLEQIARLEDQNEGR